MVLEEYHQDNKQGKYLNKYKTNRKFQYRSKDYFIKSNLLVAAFPQ